MWMVFFLLVVLGAGLWLWRRAERHLLSKFPEVDYTVIEIRDGYEIREYAPTVVAEVELSGDLSDVSTEGFGILFGYLFHNTVSRVATVSSDGGQHTVSFPISRHILPALQREHPDVSFRTIPKRRMAAIRFSRFPAADRVKNKEALLRNFLDRDGIVGNGDAELILFSPPHSCALFLQNEILIEVAN